MPDSTWRRPCADAAQAMLAAILLCNAGPCLAQDGTGRAPASPRTQEQERQLRGNKEATDSAAARSNVDAADSGMMRGLAQVHHGEIQLAALAQEISTNAEVRNFAQTLLDDHYAALNDLRGLAQAKGVILPGGADTDGAAAASKLARLTGAAFDRQFVASAGIDAHNQAVKLFEEAGRQAKDADLQAYASKYLAPMNRHLRLAQQLQGGGQPAPAAAQ